MNNIPIFSPVNGVTSNISKDSITIYIGTKDKHTIYAPIEGTISNINMTEGTWERVIDANIFQITETKTKRVSISISNPNISKQINLWLEVGKPTDQIKISKSLSDNINYGDIIGEILFGSLVKIHLNGLNNFKVVDDGTDVIGGKTIIAYVEANKNIQYKLNLKQLIILTVPHAKCDTIIEKNYPHSCDFSAVKFATELKKVLTDDSREIITFYGTINRRKIDLNRIQSIYTNFRKRIRNRIKMRIYELVFSEINIINKIIYVIDCHSFPSNSFENVRINNPDVCILMADCLQLTVVEELTDILRDNGINATKHLGDGNSIIEEFYSFDEYYNLSKLGIKIIPVLIEINEKTASTDEKLYIICSAINIWIQTINKYTLEKILK